MEKPQLIKLFMRFLKENQIYGIIIPHFYERFVTSGKHSTVYAFLMALEIKKYTVLLCNYTFMFDWNQTSEGPLFWNLIHIYWKMNYYREQDNKELLIQVKNSFSQFLEYNDLETEYRTKQTNQLITKIKKDFNI